LLYGGVLGKYAALAEYLRSQRDKQEVSLSFKQIEDILGFELPISAKKYRCWWANDESHVQAMGGWMSVGWTTKSVNLREGKVTFAFKSEIKLDERRELPKLYVHKRHFEDFAREIMQKHFGVKLMPKKLPGWPKLFDMVSHDNTIVGEAIFIAASKEKAKILPGRLCYITEKVWLLEKTDAKIKFIVFGGDIATPREWLKKYGKFSDDIQFYIIADNGVLSRLD
jgi:hypothetical protein